jgi:hypothetical protein
MPKFKTACKIAEDENENYKKSPESPRPSYVNLNDNEKETDNKEIHNKNITEKSIIIDNIQIDEYKKLKNKLDFMVNNHKEEIKNLKNSFSSDIEQYKDTILNLQDELRLKPEKTKKNKPTPSIIPNDIIEPLVPKCILDLYPIPIYNVTDDDAKHDKEIKELLYFANMEEYIVMNHNSDLVDRVDIIKDKISIDYLVEFRLKYENKKITDNSKLRMKRKIIRSKQLFKDYSNKLSNVKIYMSYLGKMTDNEFKVWEIELRKILNCVKTDEEIEEKICTKIIKSGKNKGNKCGKTNCTRHMYH